VRLHRLLKHNDPLLDAYLFLTKAVLLSTGLIAWSLA
jgi:hypothetical protein